jgi:hypothetical protein
MANLPADFRKRAGSVLSPLCPAEYRYHERRDSDDDQRLSCDLQLCHCGWRIVLC